MIKAAIFDLDGTILDSMRSWDELDANFLRSLGLEPRPGLQQDVMALTLRQSAQYFRREYGVPLSEDEIISRLRADIRRAYESEIQLKPGAQEALELLRERGISMAVATATEEHLALAALTRLGVLDYFSGLYTCDMVGRTKRFPDVFLAAAEHLGSSPGETLVFEDAPFAAKTAHDAGFPVALVYDPASHSSECAQFASVELHDFAELRSFLDKLSK
ncbi:MAG TPA: HAD family phosphatase [Firmicutes bacterium]|nr:HAD family phosphatase [Bacillota bacterium]